MNEEYGNNLIDRQECRERSRKRRELTGLGHD